MARKKYIYYVNGWTNSFDDVFKLKGDDPKKEVPKRIVLSRKPLVKGAATFSRKVLFDLGMLPFEESRLCVMVKEGEDMGGYPGSSRPVYRKAELSDVGGEEILYASSRDMNEDGGRVLWPYRNYPEGPDICEMGGVDVLGGVRESYFMIKEIPFEGDMFDAEKYLGVPKRKIFTYRLDLDTCEDNLRLAGVPGYCEMSRGRRALVNMKRDGVGHFADFFKMAVKKNEGLTL